MRKLKILLIIFVCTGFSKIQATGFEGIITQNVVDVNKGSMIMKWYIKENQVKLEVIANNEVVSFITSGKDLLIYASVPSEDGNFYYSSIKPSMMKSDIEEATPTKTDETKDFFSNVCGKIRFRGNNVNGSFYYLNDVNISPAYLYQFFQNSYELKMLSQLNLSGFPVQSTIYVDGKMAFNSELIKIEKLGLKEDIFIPPSNYRNLPVGE